MTEEQQAQALARWLDAGARGDLPEGVDPDVLEAVLALRPDLAPAPRVTVDDILADVREGPFAAPAETGGAEVVPFPVPPAAPPAPAPRTRWWRVGGAVGALAAAATLALVLRGGGGPSAPVHQVAREAALPASDLAAPAPAPAPVDAAVAADAISTGELAPEGGIAAKPAEAPQEAPATSGPPPASPAPQEAVARVAPPPATPEPPAAATIPEVRALQARAEPASEDEAEAEAVEDAVADAGLDHLAAEAERVEVARSRPPSQDAAAGFAAGAAVPDLDDFGQRAVAAQPARKALGVPAARGGRPIPEAEGDPLAAARALAADDPLAAAHLAAGHIAPPADAGQRAAEAAAGWALEAGRPDLAAGWARDGLALRRTGPAADRLRDLARRADAAAD